MNETLFYHAVAIASHGDRHVIEKYRAGTQNWEEIYRSMEISGVAVTDPLAAFERLGRLGIRLALSSQTEYPEALRHIPHPPFGIYMRGEAAPFTSSAATIAIVGTRRASADGKATARRFARELAAADLTIASGLAFGIDAAAHEGALDAYGTTVAVLAGGLDAVYPRSHNALACRILKNGGMLISEYPPGEQPLPYRFIERNRIMSGISRGVLVVEAPESSGALATARYAVDQNREVFVTPGALGNTNVKGSHALIRQGAELVTSPEDILETYGVDKKKVVAAAGAASSPEETLILRVLANASKAIDIDKLLALTKLEPRTVNRSLSFLLIRGIVKESEGGYTI